MELTNKNSFETQNENGAEKHTDFIVASPFSDSIDCFESKQAKDDF